MQEERALELEEMRKEKEEKMAKDAQKS